MQELIDHFRLIQEADLSYPIILCSEARTIDAMQQVAKAKMMKLNLLQAVKFKLILQLDFIGVDENDLSCD